MALLAVVMAPADPLGLTPWCTKPQDKGDSVRAKALKALSLE